MMGHTPRWQLALPQDLKGGWTVSHHQLMSWRSEFSVSAIGVGKSVGVSRRQIWLRESSPRQTEFPTAQSLERRKGWPGDHLSACLGLLQPAVNNRPW